MWYCIVGYVAMEICYVAYSATAASSLLLCSRQFIRLPQVLPREMYCVITRLKIRCLGYPYSGRNFHIGGFSFLRISSVLCLLWLLIVFWHGTRLMFTTVIDGIVSSALNTITEALHVRCQDLYGREKG